MLPWLKPSGLYPFFQKEQMYFIVNLFLLIKSLSNQLNLMLVKHPIYIILDFINPFVVKGFFIEGNSMRAQVFFFIEVL